MKLITYAATSAAVMALAAAPALGQGRSGEHKLAAPGQYCKAASKQHVEGEKGTPFSICVRAQAKLRKGSTDSPRAACKAASHKHVKGQKGTPFSVCVKAGAKLLRDQKAASS